jgi:hypothetical protein
MASFLALSTGAGMEWPLQQSKQMMASDSSTSRRLHSSLTTSMSSPGKPPPFTPAMVAAYATQLGGRPPGHNWTSRFVSYHSSRLASGYLSTLDLDRHQADSVWPYEQYYQLVNEKLQEYQITSDNIYNMDEKGLLMGRLTKTKRIFSQDLRGSGKLIGVSQDDSRE